MAIVVACGTRANAQENTGWMRDLEDLLSVQVTSAGRKEQRLGDTAAAVFVLTGEDIRRSGLTTIPDLLRLVPGMHVARIDSGTWAVTARGFNSRIANKLLVMINGRSMYTRLYSGVSWELIPVPIEEIDRIEVIRGPGASVWGANAVNGVINIITRRPTSQRESVMSFTGGSLDYGSLTLQHGGPAAGANRYRLFGQVTTLAAYPAPGMPTRGDSASGSGGASFEHALSSMDTLYLDVMGVRRSSESPVAVLEFVTSAGRANQLVSESGWGWAVTSRWTHELAHEGAFVTELSASREGRDDVILVTKNSLFDLGVQHRVGRRGRHDLTWGAAYRNTWDRTLGIATVQFDPATHSDHQFNSSIQDEIALTHRLSLTVGSRLEYHTYVGWSLQPSARAHWRLTPSSAVWTAVSRADRTPSRFDRDLSADVGGFIAADGTPVRFSLLGNPAYESEHLVATEAGYRFSAAGLQVDVAGYYNRYSCLPSYRFEAPYLEIDPPVARLVVPQRLENMIDAETTGVEIGATVRPTAWLKLSAGYTLFALDVDQPGGALPAELQAIIDSTAGANGLNINGRDFASNAPTHQGYIRASASLPRGLELDATVFAVDELVDLSVPGYTRFDTRASWRLRKSLRLSAVFQNLLDDRHLEFESRATGRDLAEVPRQALGTVIWEF